MSPGDDVEPGDASAYANQAAWRRFLVILAGPAMNYLLAVLMATCLLATVGLRGPDPSARVGMVVAGGPADQAGLRAGDRIVTVDRTPVDDWPSLVEHFQSSPGKPLSIEVLRPGPEGAPPDRLSLSITPRDQGGRGRVDIRQAAALQREAGLDALSTAFRRTNQLAVGQLAAFGAVFRGNQGAELSGPIGIGQQLVAAAHEGVPPFLALVWQISLVLAILNLLPVPALDGGRLVFLVIEMVTRRRVNERVEGIVHTVGFVALLALLLGVTVFGDLARLLRR
jgi:regulator of sigma E protease